LVHNKATKATKVEACYLGILSLRPLWPCCELIPGLFLTFASVREILIRLFLAFCDFLRL